MAGKSKSASTGYFNKEMLDILKKGEKKQSSTNKGNASKSGNSKPAKKK